MNTIIVIAAIYSRTYAQMYSSNPTGGNNKSRVTLQLTATKSLYYTYGSTGSTGGRYAFSRDRAEGFIARRSVILSGTTYEPR